MLRGRARKGEVEERGGGGGAYSLVAKVIDLENLVGGVVGDLFLGACRVVNPLGLIVLDFGDWYLVMEVESGLGAGLVCAGVMLCGRAKTRRRGLEGGIRVGTSLKRGGNKEGSEKQSMKRRRRRRRRREERGERREERERERG